LSPQAALVGTNIAVMRRMTHAAWQGPNDPCEPSAQVLTPIELAEAKEVTLKKATDLLARLRTLDVRLTISGNRLACDAPKGVLNEELKVQLGLHKSALIELIGHGSSMLGVPNLLESEPKKRPIAKIGDGTLSFAQQRLWYQNQFESHGAANNISVVLRMEGRLDVGALDQALREIVRRHAVLRTAFLTVDGSPSSRVLPEVEWKLAYHDLRSESPHDESAGGPTPNALRFSALLDSALRKPIDLTTGNLLRANLIQTSQDESTLILVTHHIVVDGWSLGVLMRELASLYSTYQSARPPELPDLQLQYSDYVAWQQEWLETGVLNSELPYWESRLRYAAPVDLPPDRPRPAVMTYSGKRIKYRMSPLVVDAIRDTARSEGVTLYMALLSGFYILLHRYTRQIDLTVGGVTAGRHKPEFENLIGLFINSLAFRTSLGGDPTIRELLGRVKETTLDGLAHQHVPFEQVVAAAQAQRDSSRAPLFDLMFIFQNLPFRTFDLPGLKVHPVEVDQGTSRFDLTVEARENEGTIELHLEYRTDLYEENTIRRLAIHFERLLAEMTVDPHRRISELPMLPDAEISGLLETGQGRVVDYPRDKSISELIDRQSAASPGAVAVVCKDREMTYGELSGRSNQLAHYLRTLGVSAGTLVGICLDRSEEMVVAVLAVWKAGAAYVPLDPQYPADRLAFMAQDAAIPVLITEESLRNAVPVRGAVRTVVIDTCRETITAQALEELPSHATGNDLAYVIFTSGSTGKPKGVQITHRALANFLFSMLREPGVTGRDSLLSVTTLSFDIAGLEIYLPLMAGARSVIATREVASDGRRLAELISRSRATVMQATPSTWRLLLDAGWQGTPGLKVICGGEALTQDLARRLLASGVQLWNAYGPTETTIWSTLQRVTAPEDARSIGRPIANTRILLLDEHRHLVSAGATGELYIGGDGLAHGYLNRPALTQERFIDHPLTPGERLYRTGDLARWLPDGGLEFLGRIDQQVKIRGFRVELEEIEAALEAIPHIRQAVVVMHEFATGDQRLVAYVSLRGKNQIDPLEIRKRVSSTLPDYMVPAYVVTLSSIPLTPNGKVDKRALPPPTVAAAPTLTPPRSDVERSVAEVWQEVLNRPEIGIHDNFFDVGGHSLLLVQMQNRLRRAFGSDLSIQDLFRNPTVAAIAEHLSAQGALTGGGHN
jgi:amino acid adenylation domain-containing protein